MTEEEQGAEPQTDAEVPEASPPAPPAAAAPEDANDLRGFHFKRLMRMPRTWLLIAVPSIVVAIVLAAVVAPVIGVIILAVLLVAGVGVVFAIADSQAADDFFAVYAGKRGLTLGGKSRLPAATPLLRKGDSRYADRTMTGPLAPGVEGSLVLFTYEDETTDSDGNQQTNYYHYTLGMTEIPECVARVPELYCQRKSGLRSLEKFEDVFRRSKQRVKLESGVLDQKYEIFSTKDQDAVWMRRLFSPTFIVWMCDSAPKKFAFELVNGTLVAYVNGHEEDAADLDEIARAAATVAARLRDEVKESDPPDPEPAETVEPTPQAGQPGAAVISPAGGEAGPPSEAGGASEAGEQGAGVGDQAGGDHQEDGGDEDEGDD